MVANTPSTAHLEAPSPSRPCRAYSGAHGAAGSALMALTAFVNSSCASVKARFGNSGSATASPSAPYAVSTIGSPGPFHETTARGSMVSVTRAGLAGLMRDSRPVVFSELCGVSAHVRFCADFVRYTPNNRRSRWDRGMTACDPQRKSRLTNSWHVTPKASAIPLPP